MIAATSSGTPYVEIDEKEMECSFRSLEFVNAMYVKEGAKIPVPKLSEVTHSGIRQVPGKRSPSQKGFRKETARHAEANCSDPEERSVRGRVQA